MSKYRITRHDQYNFAVEEYQEGGGIVSRGLYAGREKQARWKAPELFYKTLEDATRGLLNKAMGDAMLEKECQSILEAIALAESRVMSALKEFQEKPLTSVPS